VVSKLRKGSDKNELPPSGRLVTAFRSRQNDFEQFVITQGELSACKNVEGLMTAMNIGYNPEEWRLFTDSSLHSLQAVLSHKGNVLPSIPVAFAVHRKETYENTKEIISRVNYKTSMARLWWFEGNRHFYGTAKGLHKILFFPMQMG
jgi:hypothetical protein